MSVDSLTKLMVHEAAHCAACHAMGVEVHSVNLETDCGGAMVHTIDNGDAFASGVIDLAGIEAEKMMGFRVDEESAAFTGDFNNAIGTAMRNGHHTADYRTIAAKIVREQREAIAALSNELACMRSMGRKRVSGEQVERVLRANWTY